MKKIIYVMAFVALSSGGHLVWAQEDDDVFNRVIKEQYTLEKERHHSKEKNVPFRNEVQFKEETQEKLENFFNKARLHDLQTSRVLQDDGEAVKEKALHTLTEKDQQNWEKILAVLNNRSSVYDHIDKKDDKKINHILHNVKEIDMYFPCSDALSGRGQAFYKNFESLCKNFDLSLETCKTFLLEDGENFCRSIPNLQGYPTLIKQEVERCQKGIQTLVHPTGTQKLKNFFHSVRNKHKTSLSST